MPGHFSGTPGVSNCFPAIAAGAIKLKASKAINTYGVDILVLPRNGLRKIILSSFRLAGFGASHRAPHPA
jgi:hypothetical protein